MQQEKVRAALAGGLASAAVALNPWLLGRLTADGAIESADARIFLLLLEVLLVVGAAWLYAGRVWPRRLFLAVLAVTGLFAAFSAPGLIDRYRWYQQRRGPLAESHALLARVASLAAGKATLGLETAAVLHRPGRRRERFEIVVPERGVLDTGVGIEPALGRFFTGKLRFEAVARPEDGPPVRLWSRSYAIGDGADESGWHPLSFDLAKFAGERLVVELGKAATGGEGRLPFDLEATDLALWRLPRARSRRLDGRRNLILVSLDTVRADHVGFMGYGRETTPRLDELAAAGVVFSECISQAPWTTPSHFSILTGTHPGTHQANQPIQVRQRRWRKDLPTLAGILAGEGYLTAAFTGRGSISADFGFDKGFDTYNESALSEGSDVEQVVDKALAWLARNRERSFFLFLHTYEPHWPFQDGYFAEREGISTRQKVANQVARYDGDIRRADLHLGRLLDDLRQSGLLESTLVVVTSDHGEEFQTDRVRPDAAHNFWGHGHSLFDEVLRVPLLFSGLGPAVRPGRIDGQVRSIDILPTVLDYLEIEPPATLEGTSLRPRLEGASEAPRPAFSEATTYGAELESVRWRGFKYIQRVSYGQLAHPRSYGLELPAVHQLFDLSVDPGEKRNLSDVETERLAELRQLMAEKPGRAAADEAGGADGDAVRDERLDQALRALGYLD